MIGDLTSLTTDICTQIANECSVVLYGTADDALGRLKNVRHFKAGSNSQNEKLEKLFLTYSFDAVVMFSPAMMRKPDWSSENAWLHTVFELCKSSKIERVIYVTLDVTQLEAQETSSHDDYEILLREDTGRLCLFYGQYMNLTVLKIPYLYDAQNIKYPLSQFLQIAHSSERLYFAYAPDTKIDFLSMRDFTQLLLRVLDSSRGGEYTAQADKTLTLQKLGEALCAQKSSLKLVYNDETVGIRLPRLRQQDGGKVREDFGWIAKDMLLDEMPALYSGYSPDANSKRPTLFERIKRLYKHISSNAPLRYLAVTALFVFFAALNIVASSSADFSFIDFHLVFVALIGTVYGLNCGIYSAVLVCISTLASFIIGGTDAQIVFYNMENWLPFVFYLIVGAVLGYMHDNLDAKIRYTKREYDVLEGKYTFVKTAYEDMLLTKAEMKKQIIGANESFGKIYEITKQIDKKLPSEIMFATLKALESTLENNSVAIYMLDAKSSYARLAVCSYEISATLLKSVNLSKYSAIMDDMTEGEVWCNTSALAGYPSYCANIYDNGSPVYLIFIYNVSFQQMSNYYVNQIKILCGLSQNAFIRGLNEYKGIQTQSCVTGTELLKPEYFAELIKTHDEMRQKHLADYLLCRVQTQAKNVQQLNDLLLANMRMSDTAGLDADGTAYILFAQATANDFGGIAKRYAAGKITLLPAEGGDFKG